MEDDADGDALGNVLGVVDRVAGGSSTWRRRRRYRRCGTWDALVVADGDAVGESLGTYWETRKEKQRDLLLSIRTVVVVVVGFSTRWCSEFWDWCSRTNGNIKVKFCVMFTTWAIDFA